ncbi:hypothetical protein BDV93DRAFT_606253 [Ceratobasidium sp. AG-I]|nr:hypothetical protein BDV93DRAFT_606253 [Ceratobasidium sp. AG-I]
MFFNTASLSVFFLAASSLVSASPIRRRSYGIPAPITPRASIPVTLGGVQVGFNQQGGNLDDFFGVGNFAGNFNQVTIIQQQQQLVCSANDLRVVRQQLAVIQEFAKQVILQQICEVEIQTVIIQQLNAQFVDFGRNVRRRNNNNAPSFDIVVAQKITQITQIISQGGSLAGIDLGFLGSDIGRNSVRVGGSNWNDATSPNTVGNAYKASKEQQKKSEPAPPKPPAPAPESTSTTEAAASATESSVAEAATTSASEAAATSSEAAAATSTSSAAEATPTPARN